ARASERLTPVSLAEIVARYLAEGPPPELPAVEVLVDPPRFGVAPSGVTLHARRAAYVGVRGGGPTVGAVRVGGPRRAPPRLRRGGRALAKRDGRAYSVGT